MKVGADHPERDDVTPDLFWRPSRYARGASLSELLARTHAGPRHEAGVTGGGS